MNINWRRIEDNPAPSDWRFLQTQFGRADAVVWYSSVPGWSTTIEHTIEEKHDRYLVRRMSHSNAEPLKWSDVMPTVCDTLEEAQRYVEVLIRMES